MKTIEKAMQAEINIKNSQFICSLFPTTTKKESKEIIQKLKQQYHDATHNCTAYITNDGEDYDDNGEPSGTVGKPMINALRKNDLHNITAVVTRYFGGIKLGAGGLARAYSKAVLEAIEISEIIEVEYYNVYNITFNYYDLKDVEREIRNNKLTIIQKDFSDKISYDLVSKDNKNLEKVFEKFHGKIKVSFKNKQILKKIR